MLGEILNGAKNYTEGVYVGFLAESECEVGGRMWEYEHAPHVTPGILGFMVGVVGTKLVKDLYKGLKKRTVDVPGRTLGYHNRLLLEMIRSR